MGGREGSVLGKVDSGNAPATDSERHGHETGGPVQFARETGPGDARVCIVNLSSVSLSADKQKHPRGSR